MNPWVLIVAQYGLPFALDLARIIATKTEPTVADWEALADKYAGKTAQQYLDNSPLKPK